MTLSVSVLIPTHNRAEILERSLESLRDLRPVAGTEVEAVIVANACTDATEVAVQKKAESFPFALRVVQEPEPGLNVARNAGARAARGNILAYLDDDAFVEPGWLLGVVRAFTEYPADLVAGRVVLWWEAVERPSWSSPAVERLLSCVDLGPDVLELSRPGLLVGANFAVRREVLEGLGGFVSDLDRVGRHLLSGGDTELALRAQTDGYRLYYSPEMAVRHWVAPSRLSRGYLDRIASARGRTAVLLGSRTGARRPLRFLKEGLAQAVAGGWQELWHGGAGDRRRATAGRLLRRRGLGKVQQILREVMSGHR